jgi:hypothetical protein
MSEENVEIVRDCFDTFNALMSGEITEEALTRFARRVVDPQFGYHWRSRRGMFPDTQRHVQVRDVEFFVRRGDALEAAGLRE